MQIWEYWLSVASEQLIELPHGAKILSVDTQGGRPILWVLGDPRAELAPVKILSYATGEDIEAGRYIGTYHVVGDMYIRHIFAVGTEDA